MMPMHSPMFKFPPSFPPSFSSSFLGSLDHPQIASFFLGAVFITSLNYSFQWTFGFFPRVRGWVSQKRSPPNDLEKSISEKAYIASSLSKLRLRESLGLVFALSLCFVFASIAYFASLLEFSIKDGADSCAFLVAWGGVASQTASIIGILALLLELKGVGIPNEEFYSSLVFLFIDLVLIFVNNAIGTGTLVPSFGPVTFCYWNHFLPTALATSLIPLFLEIYVLLRFAGLLTRRATLASQRLAALCDSRIGKVLSLLLLQLLTIGPSAMNVNFNVLADFIPLSIGALFVLWTFNTFKTVREEEDNRIDSRSSVTPFVLPGSARPSTYMSVREAENLMYNFSAPAAFAVPDTVRPLTYRSVREEADNPNPPNAFNVADPRRPSTYRSVREEAKSPMYKAFADPVRPSVWYSTSSESSENRRTGDIAVLVTPLAVPTAVVRPLSDRYQAATSRFSMSPDEDAIRIIKRSSQARTRGNVITPVQSTIPSPVVPKSVVVTSPNVMRARMMSPEPSVTPTSILMHPWHEKNDKRKKKEFDSKSGSPGSVASTIREGERTSYTVQGLSFPIPPTSPNGAMRRYSSSTLASPALSEEGGQGQKVHLLTFASVFRNSVNGEERPEIA